MCHQLRSALAAVPGLPQAGVGEEVERPPWLEEWGGGASIENPHVQRVHYCSLLVRRPVQSLKRKPRHEHSGG